jgi:hypothetical protein
MKTKRFLKYVAVFILGLSFLAPIINTVPTYADDYDVCGDSSVPEYVRQAHGCSGAYTEDTMSTVIVSILNAVIGVAGIVAVIFIIIGGINYMTSGGDSTKVEKGKKTIIYALIGLVICALAFAIVNWVVAGVLNG